MATTEQVSFSLVRFEWTPPDRLDVAGSWTGVEREDVSDATLVLYGGGGAHRLKALPGGVGTTRNWSAVFAWTGDLESIQRAELVVGDALVVALPVTSSHAQRTRRRFGRTPLAVREVEPQADAPIAPGARTDVLALHAATVAAQEEAAEARDALARMQSDAERAREQAKRERARRESDTARLHESLNTLRGLAEDALQTEREATRNVLIQLEEVEASTSGLQREAAEVREHAERAIAERDEAMERARAQQAKIERLEPMLDQLSRSARETSERGRVEMEEARTRLREQQRSSAAQAAELEELRAAHEAARDDAARARAQLDGVAVELADARRARQEAESMQSELAGAQQEVDALRSALADGQEEADALRSQLAGAQRAFDGAKAEAERLRGKLTALREVFEQGV